jgi:hypothetical protein
MNTERTNVGWGFWLAWVLASIMGFGMGSLIGMSVSYALLPGMGITDEFGVAHLNHVRNCARSNERFPAMGCVA